MQLIIDISEREYGLIKRSYDVQLSPIEQSIYNGTPLPEHHGRLLILDEEHVEANMFHFDNSCLKWVNEVGLSNSLVKIIPATEEGDGE